MREVHSRHIVSVKKLSADLSDEEAIERRRLALENGVVQSDDFKVWRRRKVYWRNSRAPR